jgi:hypothetical protein
MYVAFCMISCIPVRGWQHLAAALVGSCAVIFRQTNAVWIAFVLGTSIVKDLAQATDKGKSRPWYAFSLIFTSVM